MDTTNNMRWQVDSAGGNVPISDQKRMSLFHVDTDSSTNNFKRKSFDKSREYQNIKLKFQPYNLRRDKFPKISPKSKLNLDDSKAKFNQTEKVARLPQVRNKHDKNQKQYT